MSQPERVMIIRHAEKPSHNEKDERGGVKSDGSKSEESLSVRGWQRAGALSLLFGSADIAHSRGLSVPRHLYAANPEKADHLGSKSRRPKETLEPLALRLGVTMFLDWSKGQENSLCKDVLTKSGTVLISWQHELIPAIAAAIPGGSIPQTKVWADERFDLVWVLDRLTDGKYSFREIRQALLAGDAGLI